jgi:hypothetical protein
MYVFAESIIHDLELKLAVSEQLTNRSRLLPSGSSHHFVAGSSASTASSVKEANFDGSVLYIH